MTDTEKEEERKYYEKARDCLNKNFNKNLDNAKELIERIEKYGYRVNRDDVGINSYSITLTMNTGSKNEPS